MEIEQPPLQTHGHGMPFMSILENIYHAQDRSVLCFIRFMEVPPLQSDLSWCKAIEA